MTAGERLRALAGQAGAAGALLLMIGSGASSGAALVDYSGLATGTAADHLLADHDTPQVTPTASLGRWPDKRRRRESEAPPEVVKEPIPATAISRLRDEMVNGVAEFEVTKQAAALRQRRSEEETLILMII